MADWLVTEGRQSKWRATCTGVNGHSYGDERTTVQRSHSGTRSTSHRRTRQPVGNQTPSRSSRTCQAVRPRPS
jgi:hypothetical protein